MARSLLGVLRMAKIKTFKMKQAVYNWKQMVGTVTISSEDIVREADPRIYNWHVCGNCGLINVNNHRKFYWVLEVRGKFLCQRCVLPYRLKALK